MFRTGTAGVMDAVLGLDFPITKEDLLRFTRGLTIEFERGCPIELAQVLASSPLREFDSILTIAREVEQLLEKKPQ